LINRQKKGGGRIFCTKAAILLAMFDHDLEGRDSG